ncbi:MAG: methyltransferase domain-containing protein, partial [Candidatus Hydrogenedentes bacterium]|nr:methyltransferase domain-containing protein [Candidatus Hydrogenedentota bacterium]
RAPRMPARARVKDIPALWVNAHATRLPFADGAFDFIFGVLMLHLNLDIAPLLAECYRVLSQGRVAFVTAPHDFIRNHVLNIYFPTFAKIDLERFQSEEAIAEAMSAAGFSDIQSELTKRDPEPIDTAYADKVANHFITTLRLIPEDEFAAGLQRLRADIAEKGRLDEPMVWEAAVISGLKDR